MYGETEYGIFGYSQDELSDEEIKPFIPELMKYLPLYYNRKLGLMSNVQDSISEEVGRVNYFNEDLIEQTFVKSATWGLDIWEKDLGIETDISKTYEARREAITAKLRGSGTVTAQMLKNTALSFTNAEIEVIENHDDYSFVIKFVGIKGIPPNMPDFIEMVENIKPAHLDYSIEYIFSWWDNIKHLTWNQANTHTWNEIREY